MKKNTGGEGKKRVLILSATAGAGHVRAGNALTETAYALSLPLDIQHEDILNFTFPLFKKLYNDLYFALVNTSPDLWGYLYKHTESSGKTKQKSPFIKLFDHFNYKKYLRVLEELRPDAILCTHFLPYQAIADDIVKSIWKIPFFVVTTDYDVHTLWINPAVHHYYVATEEAAWTVHSHGIPENQITVTGIPVMPQFITPSSRTLLRNKFQLSANQFTIMILSGGYGVGVIDKLVISISEFLAKYARRRFQLLVVCGKNQPLYEKLKRLSFPTNITPRFFQFISYVDELMDCADVLISKSGGLTVSEAVAKHLPMVIFDPIPGQEAHNADYLTENGAAWRAANVPNLNFKLMQLIEHPELLKKMEQAERRIARPEAAKHILEDLILRLP
ncbi:MAG: glycosyltransferase [Bacteroidota bacterium]|nr:glycosyltransferase [Bacteroidota bacterium]